MTAPAHSNDLIWDQSLIEKYDVPGPRYTSYPTALQFDEGYTAEDYADSVGRLKDSIAPLSLYFHIPFCENICYYCACNKVVTRQKEKARHYLSHLVKEIALQSEIIGTRRPVTQLHWGGGTPTFLSPAEMTKLMHAIASHFKLIDSDNREYSIEIDPRTVERETLALLKGLGFNRISMGIQDFDPQVQKAINRIQSVERVRELSEAVRSYGFKSLSFDLIYGLPHQSLDTVNQTLEKVIELNPDRISLYNYAHLPHLFKSQRSIDRLTLPSADQKIAILMQANQVLSDAGYLYIGMDHFVKPEDELARAQTQGKLQRNFQGYSTCLASDLVGMGASSISSIPGGFAQNEKTLEDYYKRLDNNELPIWRGFSLNSEDELRRHIIMQLICNMHLDIEATEQQFGIEFDSHFAREVNLLREMAIDQLLTLGAKNIQITELGRPMLRNICMVFDEYLAKQKGHSYSKTL